MKLFIVPIKRVKQKLYLIYTDIYICIHFSNSLLLLLLHISVQKCALVPLSWNCGGLCRPFWQRVSWYPESHSPPSPSSLFSCGTAPGCERLPSAWDTEEKQLCEKNLINTLFLRRSKDGNISSPSRHRAQTLWVIDCPAVIKKKSMFHALFCSSSFHLLGCKMLLRTPSELAMHVSLSPG